MDANPAHRPAARGAIPNRCEHHAVPLHDLMAVHARLSGRNVRDAGNLDRGVTVAAIETELADVELVAVRDGLCGTVADVCVPRGKKVPDARDRENRNDAAHDRDRERDLVPPGREDLRQRLGLHGAGGQLPRPRVRYGNARRRHIFAPPRICRRKTERDPVDFGASYPRTRTRVKHATVHRKPSRPPRLLRRPPRHRARWRETPPRTATERSRRRARASRGGRSANRRVSERFADSQSVTGASAKKNPNIVPTRAH